MIAGNSGEAALADGVSRPAGNGADESHGRLGVLGALADGHAGKGGLGKSTAAADKDGKDASTAAAAASATATKAEPVDEDVFKNVGRRGQRLLREEPEYWTGNRRVNPPVVDH